MVKVDERDYDPDLRTIKSVEIKRPIAIGSVAQQLAKVRPKNRTHSWVVYVRGLKNEDLSYFIKCVVFQIHEDFPNPRREIYEAPFEVSESGWGEFEVQIDIHFHGMDEIYQTSHNLKLYAADDYERVSNSPVVHEMFTELIFRNPSVDLYKRLYCGPARVLPNHKYQRFWHVNETADKEQESIQAIDAAHREVTKQVQASVSQFNVLMQLIRNYHSKLKKVRLDIAKKQKEVPAPAKSEKKLLPHMPPTQRTQVSKPMQHPMSRMQDRLLQRSIAHQQSRLKNMGHLGQSVKTHGMSHSSRGPQSMNTPGLSHVPPRGPPQIRAHSTQQMRAPSRPTMTLNRPQTKYPSL